MKSFSLVQTPISSIYDLGSIVRSPRLPKERFNGTALSGETLQGYVVGAWGRQWQLSSQRLCHLLDVTTWDGGLARALPCVDRVLRAEQASLECLLQRGDNCNKALYRWNKQLLHFWSCSEPWPFPAGWRAWLLQHDVWCFASFWREREKQQQTNKKTANNHKKPTKQKPRWIKLMVRGFSCSLEALQTLQSCSASPAVPWQLLARFFKAMGSAMGLLEVDLNQVGGSDGGFFQTAVSHEMVLWDKGHRDVTAGPLLWISCGVCKGLFTEHSWGVSNIGCSWVSCTGKPEQREGSHQVPLNGPYITTCAEPLFTLKLMLLLSCSISMDEKEAHVVYR